MKRCYKCKETKPRAEFSSNKSTKDGLQQKCKQCDSAYRAENSAKISAYRKARRVEFNKNQTESRRAAKKTSPEKAMYYRAAQRARERGLPLTITPADIHIPEVCPVFGVPLITDASKASWWSASLDRIVPELGYVVGNIQVLSHKANTIKSNSTIEELRTVLEFLERQKNDRDQQS